MMEENLRQAPAALAWRSDDLPVERPISAGLLLVAVAILVIALLPSMSKKRDEVFTE
jgi:putative tricarboxylic transport membrane protein